MTNGDRIRIGLVDDHALVRDALADVINDFDSCRVNLKAAHGIEMIDSLKTGAIPDVLVLDINMPIMDGYETAAWLKENYPEIQIIVLTMFDSEMALIRLLRTGVKAFLQKDACLRELRYAIESVAREGHYYPYSPLGRLANGFLNSKLYSTQTLLLSDNELMFLKLSSTEMTYKEIAKEMFISPRTIDNYRDALFEKLDIKSRVGLAMYAIRNGIVSF